MGPVKYKQTRTSCCSHGPPRLRPPQPPTPIFSYYFAPRSSPAPRLLMRFFLLSLRSAPSHSPSLCLISLCEEGENFKSPPETLAVSDLHESRPHVPTLWVFLPLYILPISLHTPETENTSNGLSWLSLACRFGRANRYQCCQKCAPWKTHVNRLPHFRESFQSRKVRNSFLRAAILLNRPSSNSPQKHSL